MLSILAAIFAFLLLSFADDVISKTLVKNIYPAKLLMEDDYNEIDSASVVQNGGGVQVINDKYEVVYSAGINTLDSNSFTTGEFTDFLVYSKSKGVPYNYDILYNSKENFWLIVTFPTSFRLDVSLVYNREAVSKDINNVSGVFMAVSLFYLILLGVFAMIFSRITSVRITKPLLMLCEGTKRLREGDYSARVNLNLKNEFEELQNTFNDMAEKIEIEVALRKQSEEDRKKMIMDISHDLKNPLASVIGYAELLSKKSTALDNEQNNYIQIILKNSQRSSRLLNDLFEFSKLESPDFTLKKSKTDICEYLRQICGELLPIIESAGFNYNFDIPEETIYVLLDVNQMNRVLYNLLDNALRYNPIGTYVSVSLHEDNNNAIILFKDNGIGIPEDMAKNIFKPFVRVDDSRNSNTGGTGIGLSITYKIIQAHEGSIDLNVDNDNGCTFNITLPTIYG
jgi:signal transduction histidine kinase